MTPDVTMTETYFGNDAAALATVIENALSQWSTGDPRHVLRELTFCEGELKLIAKTLRARKAAARKS